MSMTNITEELHQGTGNLRMDLLMWSMLLLLLFSNTKQIDGDQSRPSQYLSRWQSYRMERGQQIIQNLKKHSDGTFTSDLINNNDKIKAKNFVKWLTCTNGQRCRGTFLEIAEEE